MCDEHFVTSHGCATGKGNGSRGFLVRKRRRSCIRRDLMGRVRGPTRDPVETDKWDIRYPGYQMGRVAPRPVPITSPN